jgi:hypothetical protein
LTLNRGDLLTPATLGVHGDSYSISVDQIGPAHILVTYGGFVLENEDGTIPLSASFTGQCLIRIRHSMRLATPSMDAGTTVALTLESVEEL